MENPRRMQCGGGECERRFNSERNSARAREHRERTGKWPSQRYRHEHACEVCGKTWTSQASAARFCSVACANSVRRWERTCETCGVRWQAGRADAKFCSTRCHDTARTAVRAAVHAARSQLVLYTGTDPRPRRPWVARLVILPPSRKRWYAGFCTECGKPFVHDQPQTFTCSPVCYKRHARVQRRAIKKSAFVENVYRKKIFERDKWRCQLCHKPVARTKSVPHPKAPVLDHVIPLAAGGTHEPANTQCAHFLCNSLKGDRGGGEQLLLIG